MKYTKLNIPDVILIEPQVFGDERGFFMETWREDEFKSSVADVSFVQDNHSKSSKGILRGLHYQIKHAQGKLVRVTQRENQSFVDKKIKKATMWFQIKEITVPRMDGHECQYFNMFWEFVFIFGLTDSGAYRWVQNVS